MVDGFIGTPKKPIKPAVINKGSRFGINETIIILNDLNMYAMNNDMITIAKPNDKNKLSLRYLVPF